MLVFMDESGNAGTEPRAGASRSFVVAGVLLPSEAAAQSCRDAVVAARAALGWPNNQTAAGEFKFEKGARPATELLNRVADCEFSAFAAVVSKTELDPKELRAAKGTLLIWTYFAAIQSTIESLHKARITIDRIGGKTKAARVYQMARQFAPPTHDQAPRICGVRQARAVSEDLVQLADVIAGSLRWDADEGKNTRRAWLEKVCDLTIRRSPPNAIQPEE